METLQGAFKLENYTFVKAVFDFTCAGENNLSIDIQPSGVYNASKGEYILTFRVLVSEKISKHHLVEVVCEANLLFNEVLAFDKIPEYFYPNSLAILFPYVRAFVSTLTLQANVRPIILPTVNLLGLTDLLKNHTKEI